MADQFKLNISAVYTQETPPQTHQVMSVEDIVADPTSYEHGKFELAAAAPLQQLCATAAASQITEIVLTSDQPVTVSLGGSGSPVVMAEVTIFVYKGAFTDVWISNPGVNPAHVQYAMISE